MKDRCAGWLGQDEAIAHSSQAITQQSPNHPLMSVLFYSINKDIDGIVLITG
jgi:hypothetical protein